MRYASLKAKDYGSGVVEAANKVLVNQRMKRARWSVAGGQNILTFRAMSGRFDAAWRAMTGTGGANDSAERRRSLTVEIPHIQTKQEYQI